MSKMVLVTYDLHDPYPNNSHSKVNKKLRALGLKKYVKKSNGKLVALPDNTFARRRDTSKDASTLRDRTKKKVDKIFEELELDYTLFIFVGSGWAWSK
jgi:ribosomal protein L4